MQSNPQSSYAAHIAQVTLLKHESGTIQVLLPSNRMLDLNKLARACNHELKAISAEELNLLRNKLQLDSESPVLPENATISTFVDQSLLLHEESLEIASSGSENPLTMSQEYVNNLKKQACLGDFSVPLSHGTSSAGQDIQQINGAVSEFTSRRISQRLEETLDIPPLPEISQKIINLRLDPKADGVELAQTIELDPSLSAQILSWARSPYYSAHGNITTLEEAVNRVLGFDLVLNLTLGLALSRAVKLPKHGPQGYAPFWQQAIATATLCAELARKIPFKARPTVGLTYLTGLLHNFGFMILGHTFPSQFEKINRHIEANPHINRLYIERHILGMSREQCAACLLEQWDLPSELVTAIRYQHDADCGAEHAKYAQLLFIAIRLLRQHGFGDGPHEAIPESLYQSLKLDQFEAEDVAESLMDRLSDLDDLIRIIHSGDK